MHSRRTVEHRRRPSFTGVLMLALFLFTVAATNPCVHELFHADHAAPGHQCFITAVDHATEAPPMACFRAAPPEFTTDAICAGTFFHTRDAKLFPERGPPVLS